MRFQLLFIALLSSCISINNDKQPFADSEIAMLMRVANLSEVREGELAREKAADPAVRDFSLMMISEHSAANSRAESELAKADIVSADTPLSRQLDAESGAATDRMRLLAGRAFDRAYIDRQVQVHQAVLNMIDKQLVPHAKKKVVKDQLSEMRKTVEQHLMRAQQIAKNLPAA